jgi:microcystin-dependent protein
MDSFIGEVRVFGFNFAPIAWALCNGAVLPIAQYAALFSILGTSFGGNGTSNFALPNLQGSTALGAGNGPGLSPRVIGEQAGTRTATLTAAQSASHNHTLQVFEENPIVGTTDTPGPTVGVSRLIQVAGGGHSSIKTFLSAGVPGAPGATLAPASAISVSGGSQPHSNTQPWLAMNFCISVSGVFPTRS